ncbi:hypothetical protein PRJ_0925 [Pseudomonas sp. XWY-1]|nr:hypothetical protein PRJ_0925 [Pseudomonas sp. XWY-1]
MAHGKSFFICSRRLRVRMAATVRRPRSVWPQDDMKRWWG